MRIALAHDHLFQMGGAENVLRELSQLYPRAPIYTLISTKNAYQFLPGVDIQTSVLQNLPGSKVFFKWFLPFMPTAWERFDFSGFDVVLSSSSAFVKGIIAPSNAVHISYCHSPTRYLWSDRVEYVDSIRIPGFMKLALMQLLNRMRLWDQVAASRVDYFIANSQFVARRISHYYGRDSVVIHPPVAVNSFTTSDSIGSYYLVVSRLRPYKRVDLAIDAFNHLRIPLVIIGDGEEYARLRKRAKSHITFLGEVSDETRNRYLARCKAFIHPQEEDFGISAVEAMAAGRPVIAYESGGALETVRQNITGVFFAEQEWESLAYAVLDFQKKSFDPAVIRSHAMKFDSSNFRQAIANFVTSKLSAHHATSH